MTRLVWTIRSYRAGENTQIRGLAEAIEANLGWPFEEKSLAYRSRGALANLMRRVTLAGIDTEASDPLTEPWPDLLISAGLRNEPVARWVRAASAGRTRLVFLGRTWVPSDAIDLVVATPQYRVPAHAHVLQNSLTLHRVTPKRLDEAEPLELDTPVTAVMLGGNSGPYAYGNKAAERLAAALGGIDGTLLISDSARTPSGFVDTLERLLERPATIYRFRDGAADNPYFDWLAGADRICVTADSIALLSEAIATGKPVAVFDPRRDTGSGSDEDATPAATGYRLLMRWGPERLSRDVSLIHQPLLASGRIAWLEDALAGGWPAPGDRGTGNVDAALERVAALFDPD